MGIIKELLQYQSGGNFNKEQRLILAILKMAEKAENTQIKTAFEIHSNETKIHNSGLQKLYADLHILPPKIKK